MLKEFVKEHFLSTGTYSSAEPTVYHFNGTDTSQIVYILSSDLRIIHSYSIIHKDSINVSPHVPVKAELNLSSVLPGNQSRLSIGNDDSYVIYMSRAHRFDPSPVHRTNTPVKHQL